MTPECGICGYNFETREEAEACAGQGLRENPFALEDILDIPGVGRVSVTELLHASYISHKPGAIVTLPDGETTQVITEEFVTYRVLEDQ